MNNNPTSNAPTMTKNSEKTQVYESPTYTIIDLNPEDNIITTSVAPQETEPSPLW